MIGQLKLTGHVKDLGGGFLVRRLLPAAQKQAVGPFVFFDHFGPVTVEPGKTSPAITARTYRNTCSPHGAGR